MAFTRCPLHSAWRLSCHAICGLILLNLFTGSKQPGASNKASSVRTMHMTGCLHAFQPFLYQEPWHSCFMLAQKTFYFLSCLFYMASSLLNTNSNSQPGFKLSHHMPTSYDSSIQLICVQRRKSWRRYYRVHWTKVKWITTFGVLWRWNRSCLAQSLTYHS